MVQSAEKIFFFRGPGNRKLLGFLHSPGAASSKIGIVFCHPFAEEKNMSHAVAAKAARMFATAGYPVFRFDFSGCGDSEGDLQVSSLENWQQDLDAAIEAFRGVAGVSRCMLWGLRLGAGLALMRESHDHDLAGLILWQPVLDFALYIKQFLRQAISSRIVKGGKGKAGNNLEEKLQDEALTHVIGYPLSKAFRDDFKRLGSRPATLVPSCPVLLLSISLAAEPSPPLQTYADHLAGTGVPVELKHVPAEPFWDRYWQWECKQAADATLRWLRRMHPVAVGVEE